MDKRGNTQNKVFMICTSVLHYSGVLSCRCIVIFTTSTSTVFVTTTSTATITSTIIIANITSTKKWV